MLKNCFGLIYAGEQNLNLVELISQRSVAALPVGGRYRAIDFQLSNLINSGIRNVGVITQRNYHSLMDHLGAGKEWDLSRKNDGLFVLPPFDTVGNHGEYRGLCDAVKGAMGYIRRSSQQFCLLSGSYTLYNRTYNDMYKFHMDMGADVTVLYNKEPDNQELSDRFKDVRLHMGMDGRVSDIEFCPMTTNSPYCGMDVYLIRKDLLEYLVEDVTSRGKYNFVTDVLMANLHRLKVYGYEHDGYVGRLHNIRSYFKLNQDMLNMDVQASLFYTGNPVSTKIKDEVPAKYGRSAKVSNSLIANGCVIEGTVEDSILFRGVYVGRGTTIKGSIIMQDSEIFQNCTLEDVVLDKKVHIRSGRRLVGDKNYPVIIKKGAIV